MKIAKFLFSLYHGVFANKNATCRYLPTCSQYAVDAVEKYGLLKGTAKTIARVASCHPFTKRPIYDPA